MSERTQPRNRLKRRAGRVGVAVATVLLSACSVSGSNGTGPTQAPAPAPAASGTTPTPEGPNYRADKPATKKQLEAAANVALKNVIVFSTQPGAKQRSHSRELLINAPASQRPDNGGIVRDTSFISVATARAMGGGYDTQISATDAHDCVNENGDIVAGSQPIERVCPTMPTDVTYNVTIHSPNKPNVTSATMLRKSLVGGVIAEASEVHEGADGSRHGLVFTDVDGVREVVNGLAP